MVKNKEGKPSSTLMQNRNGEVKTVFSGAIALDERGARDPGESSAGQRLGGLSGWNAASGCPESGWWSV